MIEINLLVEGEPQPWTVYTRRGRPSKGFQDMKAWQEMVQLKARQVMGSQEPIEGPVWLSAGFFRGVPDWAPKTPKKREAWEKKHRVMRPDGTNYLKAFEDACNGIIWADDSQVVKTEITKDYDETAHTWAVIRAVV